MATPTSFSSLKMNLHNEKKSFHMGPITSITDSSLIPFSKEEEDAVVHIILNHRENLQIMKSRKGGPDKYRRQLSYNPNLFADDDLVQESIRKKLDKLLQDLRLFIGNTHIILNLNMLLSLPDGEDQACHTDYLLQEDYVSYVGEISIPYIFLIPLSESGCSLGVYSKRTNKMAEKNIPSGHFFFGRFDCPHAGVGYKSKNIRIHCYVDPIQEELSTRVWRNMNEVYFANVSWIDYDKIRKVQKKNCLKAVAYKAKRRSENNAKGDRIRDAKQQRKHKRECC